MKAEAVTFRRGLVPLVLIGLLLDFFAARTVQATTWTSAGSGDMLSDPNWEGGNAPNSIDAVATISTQPTFPGNFSLNGPMTLGTLDYSNSLARSITGMGTLNLAVSSGTPEISVSGGTLTIHPLISGSSGLNKTGASRLVLSNSNTYTGTTTVNAGTLNAINTTGSATGSGDILLSAGANLWIGNPAQTGGSPEGAVSGNITNNGTIQFFRSNAITYAGQITGTGSLTTSGIGTVTLTGNNTYSGGTNINAGRLVLGSSGALGATGTISFNGNGILQWSANNTTDYSPRFSTAPNQQYEFDTNGQNVTLASPLTSNGRPLFKFGAGTLTLTGANTYSGATNVSGGTLAGTTVSLRGIINNNANVTFNQSTDGSYTGNMSGTGSLTKQGTGNVTLSGTNSYTGGTTVSGGMLTGNTTSLQGNIANNAAVTFNQSTAGTHLGNISGTGSFTKLGSGNLTLAGANSYSGGTTLSAGTLTGTTSSLQRNITNNAAVVFDQSTNGTYSGNMSGAGSLTKQGTGNVTLSGTNSYSGGTNINGGTLIVSADSRLGDPTAGITLGGGTLRTTAGFSSARNITVTSANGTIDAATGNLILSGLIAGAGKLNIDYSATGAGGEVVLSNTNNTYSGGTALNGGILRIAADSSLGNPSGGISFVGGGIKADASFSTARAITLTNSGSILPGNHDVTLSGPIGGNGRLSILNGGSVTLSNSGNNYSGGTFVRGTLMISTDENLGVPTGLLTIDFLSTLRALDSFTTSSSRPIAVQNSKIDTNGFDVTIPGLVTGDGALNKIGGGTLTLTNSANSFTGLSITGGAVVVAADANLGAASGSLGLGGTLRTTASFSSNRFVIVGTAGGAIDTAGNDLTLNGFVNFDGRLTKTGAGTLTLNGENLSSGGATIDGGTLKVSNTTGSATGSGSITINSGGTLAGTGSAAGNVINGGSVTPGNSPGALTIGGSYNQSVGGKVQIEIASSSSFDQLNIEGTAALAGTLEVLLLDSYMPAAGTQFDILDFDSATGTFDSLLLPTLDASLRWNTAGLYANGVLSVTFAGDYNGDFNVDAADYVVWRKTGGSPVGYNAWRSNFGQPPSSGAGTNAAAAAPEPTTLMLLLFAATFCCLRRYRTA